MGAPCVQEISENGMQMQFDLTRLVFTILSPGACYVLYPQVALNFLILIRMTKERASWIFYLLALRDCVLWCFCTLSF